jgi:hypothetical protein
MDILNVLNSSKLLWGLSTITMQLGARHVVGDLTDMQNKFLQKKAVKYVVLFAMIFVGSRDVMISVAMTIAIYATIDWLLNENSCLCIVPAAMRPKKQEERGGQAEHEAARQSLKNQRCVGPPRLLWQNQHPMRF